MSHPGRALHACSGTYLSADLQLDSELAAFLLHVTPCVASIMPVTLTVEGWCVLAVVFNWCHRRSHKMSHKILYCLLRQRRGGEQAHWGMSLPTRLACWFANKTTWGQHLPLRHIVCMQNPRVDNVDSVPVLCLAAASALVHAQNRTLSNNARSCRHTAAGQEPRSPRTKVNHTGH